MARSFNSWIDAYLDYTLEQESPRQFHFWAGISTLSSALGRRCWFSKGFFPLYPNQYVVLIGESALCRKTTAIKLATELLGYTQIEIVREKLTVGYLYRHLAGFNTNKKSDESSIVLYIPELSTCLGRDAHQSGLIATLTSIYDCPPITEYRTKTAGIDIIHNPSINMIGATTLDWMSSSLPGESIEGGFTSRIIFVVGSSPAKRIALPVLNEEAVRLKQLLIKDLIWISNIQGQFYLAERSEKIYVEWYEAMKEPEDNRLRPFFGRKGDHVLKVAMALSVAESDDLIITHDTLIRAIKEVEDIEGKMGIVFRGVAFSRTARHTDRLFMQIEKEGGIFGKQLLLRRNTCYLNSTEFEEAIKTMKEAGLLREFEKDGKVYYRIVKEDIK